MAMSVTSPVGAYMRPNMCICIRMSVGAAAKSRRMSGMATLSVPSRFPAMRVSMNV
jgi:hypothetical protein